MSVATFNIRIFKYTNWYFRLCPGRLSLTRPTICTEFNLFTHTFKYRDGPGVSYYLRGVTVSPALHVFKCCYRSPNYVSTGSTQILVYIYIRCYTVRQKFGKSFPAELNTINSQETLYLFPLTQCWEMLGEKKCPSFRRSKRICRTIQLVLVGQNLLLLADLVKTMSPLSEPLPSHRWCHSLLQSRPTPSQSAGCTFWGLY